MITERSSLATLRDEVKGTPFLTSSGRVISVRGPVVTARVPHAAIGDLCLISRRNAVPLQAQVVAFNEDSVCLAPFDELTGLTPGAIVETTGAGLRLPAEVCTLGRILDSTGRPYPSPHGNISTAQPRVVASQHGGSQIPIDNDPPNPLARAPIDTILRTGVRSIDGLCSLGYGQRVGLFASAGLGKSTLLGSIARNAEVDITVVALVGERGREVNEFVEDALGKEGLARSVVVVATSNESPIRRMLAPRTATAIAEHYRDQGKRVLLLVDSLTRTARAIREVGLSAGELPVRQGYTASVYTELPRLLERAGTGKRGSITGIYTVLANEEGETDPLGDEIKSILDGHIILSNSVVRAGVRPAIDLTISISRLLSKLHTREHLNAIQSLVTALARLKKDKDLLLLGGTPDAELAAALTIEPELIKLLNQHPSENIPLELTIDAVVATANRFRSIMNSATSTRPGSSR